MSGVTLSGDWGKLNGALQTLGKPRFARIHARIAETLLDESMQAFRDSSSPTGEKWDSLSDATLAGPRGAKGKPKILEDHRILKKSINTRHDVDAAQVGTNVEYARIHQEGGEAGRKSARVKIPARPFLGVNQVVEDEIQKIIAEELSA
jgi:phage virion morphogenesis protein